MSIYNEYFKLQKGYQKSHGYNTVVFMQIGSFYEAYQTGKDGYDLQEVSQLLNILRTKKDKKKDVDAKNPYMLGFPVPSLRKYIKILLSNNFTVVIYNQKETLKGKHERNLLGIYTYSTYIENAENPKNVLTDTSDTATECNDDHYILCIYCEEHGLNVAAIDLISGHCSLHFQYNDYDENISSVYQFIQGYNSNEYLLCGTYKDKLLKDLNLEDKRYIHIDINDECNISYQQELLKKAYNITNDQLTPIECLDMEQYPSLVITLVTCLKYAYKFNPQITQLLSFPEFIFDKQVMLLENNAANQLNLISNNGLDTHHVYKVKKKIESLYDVINNCCTVIGKRHLKNILLRPFVKRDDIQIRYNTSKLLDKKLDLLTKYLTGIPDLERLQRKMAVGLLNVQDMNMLYFGYKKVKDMYNELQCIMGDNTYLINIGSITDLIGCLESTFNTEDLGSLNFNNIDGNLKLYNEGIHEEVDNLHKKIMNHFQLWNKLEDELNQIVFNDDNKTKNGVKLDYLEKEGFHIVTNIRRSTAIKAYLKSSCDTNCRIKLDDLEFKQAPKSNSVRIFIKDTTHQCTNTELIILLTKLRGMLVDFYRQDCIKIYKDFYSLMPDIVLFVARFDIIRCNLYNAQNYKYTCPTMVESSKSFVKVKKLRHPIVERLIENDKKYIAHDVELGCDNKDGILLYGLNASGKSILMKAIGISIIMAQCGLYVPAKQFTFYPYERLFTRITGNDNIFKGQSSFVVEMIEIKHILKHTTSNSLVIGDEICRGTEFISANALVSSLLISLSQIQCSFIFATHLHDLNKNTQINKLNNLSTYHLNVDIVNGKLIYGRELIEGSGSDFYGLLVATKIIDNNQFMMLTNQMVEMFKNSYNELELLQTKKSRYNSLKYVDTCEDCGNNVNLETHHIHPQNKCTDNRLNGDEHLHKNAYWNLKILCDECHKKIHQ